MKSFSPRSIHFIPASGVAPVGLPWRSGGILPLVARPEEPRKLQKETFPPFCDSDRGQHLDYNLDSPGTTHCHPAGTPSSEPTTRPRHLWRAAHAHCPPPYQLYYDEFMYQLDWTADA